MHPHYQELKPRLGPGERALILIRPDPDSLASAAALRLLFRSNHSSAVIALYEPIRRIENRSMVSLLKIPTVALKEVELEGFSRVCLVDGQRNQFPDLYLPRLDVVIDHHPLGSAEPSAFSDIRPETGATATIMFSYLQEARIRVGAKLATALCYGIITDTDRFQRHMTREDARAFSALFPSIDYHLLTVIEKTEVPIRQLSYFDLALHRLEVRSRRAVIFIGAAESADIAVILADFFIRVSGIQFVAIACVAADRLVIVFRSRNVNKDAGKIAASLFSNLGSAGGHKAAARAEIPVDRLPAEVKLYSPDSVERFLERRLRRPGKHPPPEAEP
jgi:nanoRNase/pAp phosphatase (c-di-AMP/oligoRNAs hydrolase)